MSRIAYADPPYLGQCGRLYNHFHGDDGRCWDSAHTHMLLMRDLCDNYDRWAMSLGSNTLREIISLPTCPPDVRVMAWCKPFASFKPGVRVAYCWEPVLVHGAVNSGGKERDTVRDFHLANITMQKGTPGAKPESFCHWLFDVLDAKPDDEFFDLFHGSGSVKDAWRSWCSLHRAWTKVEP